MYFSLFREDPSPSSHIIHSDKKTQRRITSLWQTKYHCDRQKKVTNKGANK